MSEILEFLKEGKEHIPLAGVVGEALEVTTAGVDIEETLQDLGEVLQDDDSNTMKGEETEIITNKSGRILL